MKPPVVSILMPVHNGASYLTEALESVFSQDFADFEFVVVDDASTDDTSLILDAFKDRRLKVLHLAEQTGVAGSLNFGLTQCKASLVARIDADDRCLPERIKLQVLEMTRRPRLCLLGTSAIKIDSLGNSLGLFSVPTGSGNVLRRLRWRNSFIHPSVMFRRDVVVRLGSYSEKCRNAQDYNLWLRMAAEGEVDNLGDPLVEYRIHSGQVTASKISDKATSAEVYDARRQLARLKSESRIMPLVRQEVWSMAQMWGDRRRT
jgi:glycosyltransferase involved in cell wall biosynthesis